MQRWAFIIFLLLAPISASAGPLFDDYLNYVRPGIGTGPGNDFATVTSAQPIGQTFLVPENTGEIYRIGVRPDYKTWNPGERVTMALYDSSDKLHKLGEYSVDETTCRVQAVSNTQDRVLYFQFRSATAGASRFYFELSISGGDGSIAFQAFNNDKYPGGESHQRSTVIKDLAFECHVKPVADRSANLKKFFTERLDLARPELSAVKSAVDAGNWESAIAEIVQHFNNRMDLWSSWKDVMEVKLDHQYDTTLADLVVNGFLRHKETGEPVAWRKESDWAPEYPVDRVNPGHAVDPETYTWHIGRTLAGAYTATGKSVYAQKTIDLLMQFILDNPSPKTSGLPHYFELWNDRTAAARAPGHGDLVYSRLYNYPGWTNDEKLIFFSFLEDNAAWDYKADSGANWGAEASRACLDFGLSFPEWKMSREYIRWGAGRLSDIVQETARGDGVSTEASVKYHAMVARRLKAVLENAKAGYIDYDKVTMRRLTEKLEGMYDFMAYTLQPDSHVVMCGDSWYENYSDELSQAAAMINRPDFTWIATQGKQGKLPSVISKVFPESGYFIMRSDFGGRDLNYRDSRQLYIHNGSWFGSHGHNDLLSLNLYGYGRTLLIDPGQYDYTPPSGIDCYWQSRIHSMLVANGGDAKREPGSSEWVSNSIIDWFDGRHFGYAKSGSGDYVRRRVVFVKPDYFLVDDSANASDVRDWAQVWNLTDSAARVEEKTKTIETTFTSGGNLIILNRQPEALKVETAKGITSDKIAFPETRIVRLHKQAANPHFTSLLYPYKTGKRPTVDWVFVSPDDTKLSALIYGLKVKTVGRLDWTAFGEANTTVTYRNKSHQVNADFAVVRMTSSARVTGFSWIHGKKLIFNNKTLAQCRSLVNSLTVEYAGSKLIIAAKEADPSLEVCTLNAKQIIVNGKALNKACVRNGMCLPFADSDTAIIADDKYSFSEVTKSNEWTRIPDPKSWSGGYTCHETDLGRHECGNYHFNIPKGGLFDVDVYLPIITIQSSDKIAYRIPADGLPANAGRAIVCTQNDAGASVVTVNHQAASGWVKLGRFSLSKGNFAIRATNVTHTDGLNFIADAMRLMPCQALTKHTKK